jgi:hypothetical protein
LKKEEHIKFIDVIDEKAKNAKDSTYNEFRKMFTRIASESNGSLAKFATLIKKSKKIAVQKAVKKILPIIKETQAESLQFAKDKFGL